MMTTTMIDPEAGSPTLEQDSQGTSSEIEVLFDFIERSEITSLPVATPDLKSAANLSIPAMLCDEKLLEEISSIPDKMGFKIGDVADILGIKQYVLRYWETEFEVLRPKKASNNQRMYTRRDVENALLIRKLLHRDRFSIEGARNALKELKAHVRKEKDLNQVAHRMGSLNDSVECVLKDIRRIRRLFI